MLKKGFTLIELLVVIAIIAVLTAIVVSFDFNKKTDTEKQDRFTQKIASLIRSTHLETLSGRGIKSGTTIINPTSTRILISTGSVWVYYYSGSTVIGNGEVMNRSFFGDKWYGIENIYLKDKTGWRATPANDSPVEIIFTTSDISFSGSIGNSGAIIGMDIGYKWAKNILEFDRRFGKVCNTKGCLENIDGRWICMAYDVTSGCTNWITTGVANGSGFGCPSGGYNIVETSSPVTSFQCIKNIALAPSGFPPLPPSPIFVSQSGSCDNTSQFSCSPGRAVETFAGTCWTKSTWHCDGLNGGAKTAVKCEIANPACLASCKALKDSGYSSDGVYTIDPDGAGSNEPISVYCDMTTDGGGWTLIMSSASGGTCPGFGVRGDCGSASNSSLPYSIAIEKLGASDEVLTYRTQPGSRKPNGYIAKQRFSHVLWADKLVLVNDKIQFLSTDNCTNKVMGTEVPQLWHIGVTTLVDRFIDSSAPYVGWGYRWWDWGFGTCMFDTGNPTDSAQYNCGAGIFQNGFTSATYGRGLNNACYVINGLWSGNSVLMPEGAQAAVFIREGVTPLPVPLKSCLAIKEANPASADGIYTIKPDGASTMNVYCDMTTDGGGWTVIASDGTGTYTQNLSLSWAVPTPLEPGIIMHFINGKLRDVSSEMRIVSVANSSDNVTYLTKQGWLGDARLRDSEYGYMYSSDKGFDGGVLGAHKCNFSTIILAGCTYPTSWPANGSLIGGVQGNSTPWYWSGPYSWRFDGNGKMFRLGWTTPNGAYSFPPAHNYYNDPNYLSSYLMIRDKTIPVMYASCSAIKNGEINPPDGIYSIDTDLEGPELPFEVYCDMTTDGGGWTRVYDLDIPSTGDWNTYGDIPYTTSLSGKIMPFTQVAYRMQLDTKYVFASLTDFSSGDIKKIGVPIDWQYQKNITGLNIFSNQLSTATGSAGKMEFWHNCYQAIGGNDTLYDYSDRINTAGPHCYGSMQISNGTGTVFAFNKWSDAGVNDVGIGSNPTGNPDWTFAYNAPTFATKKMAVYIRDKVIPPISYASCSAIKAAVPASLDGNYTIDPDGTGGVAPFEVYCDMTTDGGGWTVFQRRKDGGTDFYRDWAQYQGGFGDIGGEHWLGNDRIAAMTKQSKTLRVDMTNTIGVKYYAQYGRFKIGDSSTKYKLNVGGYTGDAGDSLLWHNNYTFTTYDQDNDTYPTGNCAVQYQGAWWYSICHSSNLNGLWLNGKHASYADGVNWRHYTGFMDGAINGYHYSLPFTEMKIRDKLNFSSCKEIKDVLPASADGTYTIDPDGDAGSTPFSAYCDMTTDGGGWTLTAWNKGASSMVPADFFTSEQNKANAANKGMANTAASINPEVFSRAVNTTSAMLKSSAYNSTPIIENNFGTWDYNNTKCTGSLLHSSRTAWCPGQDANDDYTSADSFNIAIGGGIGIVPGWLNMGQELCYSGKGWCDFEFYLREGGTATNYVSCSAIKNASPLSTDGTYSIDPDGTGGNEPFPVYCDMTTDGGGWTVFQRRKDGGTDFYRDWALYQWGFGDINGEHWLGNDRLALMTKEAKTLRIDMANTVGAKYHAKYNTFQIGASSTKYKLNVSGYSGTAGDALSYQSGHPFTAKDQDNDKNTAGNCAIEYQWAWWYNYCHYSNLNGLWLNGRHSSNYAKGVNWMWFPGLTDGAPDGHSYSLPFTEMKFRDKLNFSSCKEIKDANPTSADGNYTIDPDGDAGSAPFSAYCDMTTDGGGWTLTAWNKGASSMVPVDFFVSEQNKANAANKGMASTAASINPEVFSRAVNTTSAMLKSSAYNSTPIIENNFGRWDYDNVKCTGSLLHTSRTVWCPGQIANDGYNGADSFNIAVNGGAIGIVPDWLSTGHELCYNGKWWCDFEFYLREGTITNYVSCNAIKTALPTSTDGNYSIDPDGIWGADPFSVYCDMTTDGGGWTRVYDLNLPAVTGWTSYANIPYATDLSSKSMPYTQVAYRMQLDSNYVFASMNDFSSGSISKLGVPVEWHYQQNVAGLNIVSNVVPNATNSAGIMEFWHHCYSPAGGNSGLYDYLDQFTGSNPHCYGSMQISNGTDTVFAFNRWSAAADYDLGLGNRPTLNPDWTYAQNSNTFTTKRLSVLIRDKVVPTMVYPTCKALKAALPASPDGTYTIDPDGTGGNASISVYCDMTTSGGGWTRISSQVVSDADRLQWLAYAGWSTTTCFECNATWPKYLLKDGDTYRNYASFRLGSTFTYSNAAPGNTVSTIGTCMFLQKAHPTHGNIVRSESDSAVDCIDNHIQYR